MRGCIFYPPRKDSSIMPTIKDAIETTLEDMKNKLALADECIKQSNYGGAELQMHMIKTDAYNMIDLLMPCKLAHTYAEEQARPSQYFKLDDRVEVISTAARHKGRIGLVSRIQLWSKDEHLITVEFGENEDDSFDFLESQLKRV